MTDERKKEFTQEAQEAKKKEFPFVVEITAAMLADLLSVEESKKHLQEEEGLPAFVSLAFERVRQEIIENPDLSREKAPFSEIYERMPGYRKEIDPESLSFSEEHFKKAIDEIGEDAFFHSLLECWGEMIREVETIQSLIPDISALPYEVQKNIADVDAVLQSDDFREHITMQIYEARKRAKAARVIAKAPDNLFFPLDKPNSEIWNTAQNAYKQGKLSLMINTGSRSKKQEALVYYGISFDDLANDLTITKQLTPFDKRVYIAAAALWASDSLVFSATQIHKAMGNSQQPDPSQIKKINDSLSKMGAARVYIDSTEEAKTNKGYAAFKYDAPLLPFERVQAYINNVLTDSAIRLFREPPLITFARERKQITTLPRKLLESPINKTDANLLLEDYLLQRISRMKADKSNASRKILFTTIFEHCEITSAKRKSRALEKIKRYLEHYKQSDWIKGYMEELDSVTIIL